MEHSSLIIVASSNTSTATGTKDFPDASSQELQDPSQTSLESSSTASSPDQPAEVFDLYSKATWEPLTLAVKKLEESMKSVVKRYYRRFVFTNFLIDLILTIFDIY